jgi:hypothetical protein
MSQGMRPFPAARLLLLLATVTALAPSPSRAGPPPLTDDRRWIGTAPLLLLSRPDVRAEIGLDATQAADADRTLDELYQQALALKGRQGQEELNRKRAIDEAGELWLQNKLSEAQRKRFSQLDLQWEGASALIKRPVLVDHLHLTAEQHARLSEAIVTRNRNRAAGADLWECERQLLEQARAILTPEQSRRWFAMLGPRFAFTRQPANHATPQPH